MGLLNISTLPDWYLAINELVVPRSIPKLIV
jgi:hypothetical protein